ncbi:DEAD-box ATP-dependent RNA helicase 13 [Glycine soja]|uniref:DEAD-box ATP-dependent RNA helicase 13 n=1 Tax=Glycine soja TaxID=3848 RepID=A0A0B2R682_GLYSO|nr:DEAD-box ATP-dependent RNA helicase 13 [Glycine soja]
MQSLCSAKTNKYTYEKTLNATVPATTANSSQRKPKRKRASARSDPELDRLDALPPPQNDDDDDAFSLFIGSNELEGGFLSLEEVDEAEYGLSIPEPEVNKRKTKKKKSEQNENLKKQQQDGIDGACSNAVVEAELDESVKSKEKKKKKNKTTNKKKDATVDQTVEQSDAGLDTNVKDDGGEEDVDETECYAWNELRLHPLLMKAICKLGFKEPTPIQKACIPAAAHQGKDVVGAAETGSGKTLAFGLPILQRLLEEREKAANMDEERGEEPEKYAPTGFLRALIIAPTRELALQVTDHLKAVAKHINVRVIPIVGGILAEKQERLLIAKPDIVVGTPGRLWELMSAGEKHLVELGVNVWTLHAQMQQRARLKAMDRFRENENGILVATDVAARGLDIPGVRTVVHYQLPHSAEVYVHRSGRTARASAEGCSIALISSRDTSKFASLCKSFSKDNFQRFPLENSYVPEVLKRLSLARQIDKITRKESQEKAEKNWFDRNASSVELVTENYDSEEEQVNKHKQMKISSRQLKKLQEELKMLISRPLQSKTFSHRYLVGAGVTPLMQEQLQQLARQKLSDHQGSGLGKKGKLVVIGQDCVDALQALRSAGEEVRMDVKDLAGKQRNMQNLKRKRKEEKKRLRDQRRKQKKKLKYGNE